MKLSPEGARLLEEREGVRLTAYQDSVGVWTIGIGHTSGAGPPHVVSGMKITLDEARAIFGRDVAIFEEAVEHAVKLPMSQNEFDAYVSFCYNIGAGGFHRSKSVHSFNAGDRNAAAKGLLGWLRPPEVTSRRYGEFWQFKGGPMYARAGKNGERIA